MEEMEKFSKIKNYIDRSVGVRKEKFDTKLAEIKRRSNLKENEENEEKSKSMKKLLKSSVYFLKIVSNKIKNKQHLDILEDKTPMNAPLGNSNLFSRITNMAAPTPKAAWGRMLKSFRGSLDKSKAKLENSSTIVRRYERFL